jgi:predicted DCC family thiol-disulfide oxidoreductase YuxK
MVTAVFDGQCVICRGTRKTVQLLDWRKRVEFMDLHEWDRVAARYPALAYDSAMGEIHVYDSHGREFAGFEGTKRMLKEIPLGFPFWLIMQLPGMTWVGQRVYKFIAKHRYAINRLFGVEIAPCDDGVCKIDPAR